MITKRRVLTAALTALALIVGTQFMACSNTTTLPTQPSVAQQSATNSSGVVLLQRNIAARGSRGANLRNLLNSLTDTEVITPADGGKLTIGNDWIGYTTLTFPPGAVDSDVTITMSQSSFGPVLADCEPSGIHFNKAATMVLSYKGAILSDLIQRALANGRYDALAMYVQDKSDPGWTRIVSTWDPDEQTVTGVIWHFSRYAIGSNG